ncbi:MAG: PAS domain-containing protein [candidate division KSB1 bacterium]|nr:PAS domain-containing protein [candidate division KSB1 bacterium]
MTMTTAAHLGVIATVWSGGLLVLAVILSAHLLVMKIKHENQPDNENTFLINNMPNPVLYFKHSKCLFANPAFYEMTGENNVKGKYFLDYFAESDQNKIRLLTYKTRQEKRQTLQYRAHLKTETAAYLPIQVVIILEPGVQNQTGYLVLYDKRKEQDLTNELEKSNKLRAAGQLASQIAHDFNNLLTPLQSYPYLIKISLPEGHKAIEYAEHLEDVCFRMSDLNQRAAEYGKTIQTTILQRRFKVGNQKNRFIRTGTRVYQIVSATA